MTAAEFRAWRARVGATVDGAAAMLGVARRTVYRWMAGECPVPAVASKLCEAILTAADARQKEGE